MAKVYADLIRKGLKKLEDVPPGSAEKLTQEGGARHGCCVRYPDCEGQEDH